MYDSYRCLLNLISQLTTEGRKASNLTGNYQGREKKVFLNILLFILSHLQQKSGLTILNKIIKQTVRTQGSK